MVEEDECIDGQGDRDVGHNCDGKPHVHLGTHMQ